MSSLKSSYFFDLSNYAHAVLFDECGHVWEAISKISDYLQTCSVGHIECDVPAGAFLVDTDQIYIGKNTVIEPGAYIKGPCWIGNNCTIRHGAYIRGNVITGDHCVIGHDTEIKSSILLNNAQAAHFAYLGNTILGNHVNLGAGTKCANLKLNHDEITIRFEGQIYPTNMRKLGAIIGDHTQVGCNSVTNPGTLIGQRVFIYPSINIGGFVPSEYTVSSSVKPMLKKRV